MCVYLCLCIYVYVCMSVWVCLSLSESVCMSVCLMSVRMYVCICVCECVLCLCMSVKWLRLVWFLRMPNGYRSLSFDLLSIGKKKQAGNILSIRFSCHRRVVGCHSGRSGVSFRGHQSCCQSRTVKPPDFQIAATPMVGSLIWSTLETTET